MPAHSVLAYTFSRLGSRTHARTHSHTHTLTLHVKYSLLTYSLDCGRIMRTLHYEVLSALLQRIHNAPLHTRTHTHTAGGHELGHLHRRSVCGNKHVPLPTPTSRAFASTAQGRDQFHCNAHGNNVVLIDPRVSTGQTVTVVGLKFKNIC